MIVCAKRDFYITMQMIISPKIIETTIYYIEVVCARMICDYSPNILASFLCKNPHI